MNLYRPRVIRFTLIIAGYAIAYAVGSLAVWWKNRGIPLAEQIASSGMFAAGDFITFVIYGGTVALVPTVLLLRWLADYPRFWTFLSISTLLLSITGFLSAMTVLSFQIFHKNFLTGIGEFGFLRTLFSPIFFLFILTIAIFSPQGMHRRRAWIACILEGLAVLSLMIHFLHAIRI